MTEQVQPGLPPGGGVAGGVDSAPGSTATRTARNVLAVAVAEVAGKLGTFVLLLVAARLLGRDDFGSFAYALAYGLLLATLPAWGLDTRLISEASRDPGTAGRLLTTVLAARTLLAVPVLLVAGPAGLLGRPDGAARAAVLLLLVASLVDTYGDAGRAVAGALQSQGGVARALVVQRVLSCVLAVAAMLGGLGLVGLSAAYLAGTLVGAASVAVAVRRLGVRLDRRGASLAQAWDFVRASSVIGTHGVVNMALFRLDAVLLGVLTTDAAVGTYAAAYRLLETVLFVSFAVSRAVFPVLAADATPARVRYGCEQAVAVVALVYVPFAAVLLLRPSGLLHLLYGAEYADRGAPATALLALAPLLYGVAYLCGYGLIALDRSRTLLAVTLTAVVVNAGANLLLIPRLEEEGAAAATTGTFALQAVLLVVLVSRRVGAVRLDRSLRLPLACLPAVVVVLLLPVPVLVAVPAAAAVFGVQVLLLAPRLAPDQALVLRRLARRA